MSLTADFDITVVDYPAKRLAGLYTRTTIPMASTDCPRLWQKFHAAAETLPDWKRKKSYGLFLKTDQFVSLDFWTLSELSSADPVPEGMNVYQLLGGTFVHCLIPSSAEILMAYHAVHQQWVKSQNEYTIDVEGACFELYPPQWLPHDAFDLYVKLKKK